MRSRTLASRLFAIFAVSLLAVWLALVTGFYLGRGWEQRDFWPLPERVTAIVSSLEAAPPNGRQGLIDAIRSQTLNLRIENDTSLAMPDESNRQANEELMKRYASALEGRAFTVSDIMVPTRKSSFAQFGGRNRHALEFRIGLHDGETLVLESIAPLVLTAFGLPVGIGAGVAGTIIALGALLTMYREIKPLRQLARALDRVELDGRLIAVPDVRRQSAEIKALVNAFDKLQTRLSQVLRGRMAMLGGISHDVRTYATRLRLRVDLIPSDIQRARAIDDISSMIQLLDDSLLAARIGATDLGQELLDLAAIVHREVESRRSLDAALQLEIIGADEMTVLGDHIALKRVFANLIDNAIKYGKAAHIAISASEDSVLVVIEDEGPGIPSEMIDVLMEPFVRAEASRGRETGGAGLGLAIVRNLVEAHGGYVHIANRPTQGLSVTVSIPKFKP